MPEDPRDRLKKLQGEKPADRKSPFEDLYGLRENPFPAMALFSPSIDDPRRNGTIYDPEFRSKEEKEFFDMFVDPPSRDTPRQIGFIRLDPQAGGRGNGKSVFLHRLMKRINEQDWNGWARNPDSARLSALGVHILPEPRRQKKFWQFVRLIFESFSESELFVRVDRDLRALVLLQLFSNDDANEFAALSSSEVEAILDSIESTTAYLKSKRKKTSEFLSLAEIILEEDAKGQFSSQFLEDLRAANFSLATMWATWRRNGTAESDYSWRNNGVNWFVNGLVPVLISTRYQRLYILLDEFEKIYIYQNTREREEFLDSLRQYFLERPSVAQRYALLTTILTIHPSIQRYLNDVWSRVGLDNLAPLDSTMIPLQSIELGRSDLYKLKHLLTTYLDAYKKPDDKSRKSLFPFADNALDAAIDRARYYPRGAIWYAHAVLTKAASDGVPPPLTREYVESLTATVKPPSDEEDVMFQLPEPKTDLKA